MSEGNEHPAGFVSWLAVALQALCCSAAVLRNGVAGEKTEVVFPAIRVVVLRKRKWGWAGAGKLALSISWAIDCPIFSI